MTGALHTPSAGELLAAWERGLGMAPAWRALILLAAAGGGASPEELARLSIGQRDARLLALRARLFGPRLVSLASCAGCGERLELEFDTDQLLAADPQDAPPLATGEPASLCLDGLTVRFRLPNSLDLLAVADQEDVEAARQALLEHCVLDAAPPGEGQPPNPLPEALAQAVVQAMQQMDPQANIGVALACPACGREWEAVLDVVAFFLEELGAWAARLLGEVHTLASAYGWREADILALSPWRRQVYLEMVRG